MKQRWKRLSLAVVMGIAPLFTAACSLIFSEQANNRDSIRYAHGKSLILNFLKNNPNYQDNFALPAYDHNNAEVFQYLAVRSISVTFLLGDLNGSLPNRAYSGTAFILGAADQATAENKAFRYYLASNMHVFDAINSQTLKANHQKVFGAFFGVNKKLINLAIHQQLPTKSDLVNISSLTTDLPNFYQIPLQIASFSGIDFNPGYNLNMDDYGPLAFDQNFQFAANHLKVRGLSIQDANSQTLLSGEYTNYPPYQYGRKLAIDFSVIKVNLAATLKYQPPFYLDYLKLLRANYQKYGDVQFTNQDVNNGYLLAYPAAIVAQAQQIANYDPRYLTETIATNLYLNNTRDSVHVAPLLTSSNQQPPLTLTYGNEAYYTPSTEYLVRGLNIHNGASGSAYINFNPKAPDKKKFTYSGIYWGVYAKSEASTNGIEGTVGAIAKLIDQRYDVIGAKRDQKLHIVTDQTHTLCGFITKTKNYLPKFCD